MILSKQVCLLPLLSLMVFQSCILNIQADTITRVLRELVPTLVGQRPASEDPSQLNHKRIALEDVENDEIATSSVQEILVRSGYKYEIYEVNSDDGYMTKVIRVVNTRADLSKLKRTPVAMTHELSYDPTQWIWASAIQSHPEKYPREEGDEPWTSSNRSLAMMLTNAGYDVYLLPTRGCNEQNQGHISFRLPDDNEISTAEDMDDFFNYWHFTMDDLVENELPRQLEKVLQVSGSTRLSLISFGTSAATTLAFLSQDTEIAQKVDNYVCLGPVIGDPGANSATKLSEGQVCANLPFDQGTVLFNRVLFSSKFRKNFLKMASSKSTRYGLIKSLLNLVCGPSDKFKSLLELPIIGHMLMPASFLQMQQICQAGSNGVGLSKYDFGESENRRRYQSAEPPAYQLANINVGRILFVNATNDINMQAQSVRQLLTIIKRPKTQVIQADGFNELDMLAAFDNGPIINEPIMRFLDEGQ